MLVYEILQKTKFLASRLQRPVAARNDVIAKKIACGLFQNRSGRPEDWTVSGPCHLYPKCLNLLDILQSRTVTYNNGELFHDKGTLLRNKRYRYVVVAVGT